jgi:ubiquinone/menaquinone biosynthesis C-methylase UbiE
VTANEEQREYWTRVAPEWVAVEADLFRVAGWFGERAIEALALEPGESVLDVGCGTGRTTVALARAVHPTGRVLGVDIAPPMLEAARARVRAEAVNGVELRVADAQTARFEPVFDAVFSQFGVMFFADPTAAFANLRSALRSGGCQSSSGSRCSRTSGCCCPGWPCCR